MGDTRTQDHQIGLRKRCRLVAVEFQIDAKRFELLSLGLELFTPGHIGHGHPGPLLPAETGHGRAAFAEPYHGDAAAGDMVVRMVHLGFIPSLISAASACSWQPAPGQWR